MKNPIKESFNVLPKSWKFWCLVWHAAFIIFFIWLAFGKFTCKAPDDRYPFIDNSRDFISQKNFIVNIQPLREELIKTASDYGNDKISIYFEFLNTGANIQINNTLGFSPASLNKVPAAMAVLKKVEKGDWKLNDRLVLMEQDRNDEFGDLYKNTVGTQFTIEELLKAMLTYSDNTAYKIFLRNLPPSDVEELFDHIGLYDLFNDNKEISAKEYARIFRSLYVSSFLERENSQMILKYLSETPFRDTLAAGLPENIIFSHKIGENDLDSEYLDSGIVYLPNRPYLITVFMKGDSEKIREMMKNISAITYKYINEY